MTIDLASLDPFLPIIVSVEPGSTSGCISSNYTMECGRWGVKGFPFNGHRFSRGTPRWTLVSQRVGISSSTWSHRMVHYGCGYYLLSSLKDTSLWWRKTSLCSKCLSLETLEEFLPPRKLQWELETMSWYQSRLLVWVWLETFYMTQLRRVESRSTEVYLFWIFVYPNE